MTESLRDRIMGKTNSENLRGLNVAGFDRGLRAGVANTLITRMMRPTRTCLQSSAAALLWRDKFRLHRTPVSV